MKLETNTPVVRIKIVGVGGGGTNAVERMIDASIPLVEYVTLNTDTGGYECSRADTKLQIGLRETKGYGAGADPQKGRRSAEEDAGRIEEAIKDCDILFITAGMGGGTGTGAAPVVASIARKLGLLTVAVVTKPFAFEGKKRMEHAMAGIDQLTQHVDSIIIIPNDNLKRATSTRITLSNAFAVADEVLIQTVKNIVEVIQQTAFINCDLADIESILRESGRMHTATALASGNNRVESVIAQIKESVLLESSVKDATGVLLCVTAPGNAALDEIDCITSAISNEANPSANVIFGMNFDNELEDSIRAVLISTKK